MDSTQSGTSTAAPARESNRGRGQGRGQGRARGRGRGGGRAQINARGESAGGDGASGRDAAIGGVDTGSGSDQASRGGRRGRGRGGGRRGQDQRQGGGGQGDVAARKPQSASAAPTQGDAPPPTTNGKAPEGAPSTAEGDEICFICADPIKFHSITPCNHKTCHICGLRMRALYKTKDCPHCRTAAPFVIFTDDPLKRFEDYTSKDITSFDNNIGIKYTNEEIVGDTVVLLRYNCPVNDCVFAGLGWPDLHRHVRSVHHRKMCDLCTRNKKVFTHEHELFADKELERHMRHGDDRPGAVDQTGFKGHPLCGFCGSRFYDDDKLYEHCREKHERCFLCDRRDSRNPHYYLNYDALEKHFRQDHFPCLDPECLERKFVVFESEMDLKAHQLAEHGNSLSKDIRRDARIVNMSSFDYRQPYQEERRSGRGSRAGGSSRREGGREGRGRGRDPNAEFPPPTSTPPLRRDELAFQRQMAIHSAQSVSQRTFGGHLTTAPAPSPAAPTPSPPGPANDAGNAGPAAATAPFSTARSTPTTPAVEDPPPPSAVDLESLSPAERARILRHSAVIERASNLLGHDSVKMAQFRQHISSYRKGQLSATQLIDSFFALFSDTSSNAIGTLVREVADLFEDKTKAAAINTAWQDWRAINEDYPSLPGLGGMRGATTSSSGWAATAAAGPSSAAQPSAASNQKHSNRVLRLKSSTRVPGSPASSGGSVTWTPSTSAARPPPPPSSFPALPPASSSTTSTSRSAASKTAPTWIGPNSHSAPAGSRSQPARARAGGTVNGEDAFPALPAAPKPTTTIFGYGSGAVRRDFGAPRDTGFNWGTSNNGEASGNAAEQDEAEETGGGKKKGKKKVLVQWG